jgi:hypothetical protein
VATIETAGIAHEARYYDFIFPPPEELLQQIFDYESVASRLSIPTPPLKAQR